MESKNNQKELMIAALPVFSTNEKSPDKLPGL